MGESEASARRAWVRAVLEEYEGPLLRYAARICGDLERARDAVQETFLRLCEQNENGLNGKLPQWLFAVCRNRVLDVHRKERRMLAVSATEFDARASREPDPSVAMEQREGGGRVLESLACLPANQQEVIRLRFQNGLSYKDIASVTGLSASNVGYLIHVGIRELRERLKSEPWP
jgi:RNA polymerase sigma-70 factor (ECF subfamily)